MNWHPLHDKLHDKLIRAARRHPPADRVPYAFEKRVMAGLVPAAVPTAFPTTKDDWSAIARGLWWAAGTCSAIALAMSVWTFAPDSTGENFDDLEQTILASVDTGLVDDLGMDVDFDLHP